MLQQVTACTFDVSNKMSTKTLPVNMTDINPFITVLSVLSSPMVLINDTVLSQFQTTSQYTNTSIHLRLFSPVKRSLSLSVCMSVCLFLLFIWASCLMQIHTSHTPLTNIVLAGYGNHVNCRPEGSRTVAPFENYSSPQDWAMYGWLIEEGLTSDQTLYRSYRGRVFTDQITQPTVSKHWRKHTKLN